MTVLAIDPALTDLWTHWCAKRAGGTVPGFEAMDPGGLGPVAERVLVVRREEDGRFRYVSVGASIRTIYGYPMEGLLLDSVLPPDRRDAAVRRYALVCDSGRPILSRNGYEVSARIRFIIDRLMLPLAHPDGTIGGVISGQIMRSALDGAALGAKTAVSPEEDRYVFLDVPSGGAVARTSGDS